MFYAGPKFSRKQKKVDESECKEDVVISKLIDFLESGRTKGTNVRIVLLLRCTSNFIYLVCVLKYQICIYLKMEKFVNTELNAVDYQRFVSW